MTAVWDSPFFLLVLLHWTISKCVYAAAKISQEFISFITDVARKRGKKEGNEADWTGSKLSRQIYGYWAKGLLFNRALSSCFPFILSLCLSSRESFTRGGPGSTRRRQPARMWCSAGWRVEDLVRRDDIRQNPTNEYKARIIQGTLVSMVWIIQGTLVSKVAREAQEPVRSC